MLSSCLVLVNKLKISKLDKRKRLETVCVNLVSNNAFINLGKKKSRKKKQRGVPSLSLSTHTQINPVQGIIFFFVNQHPVQSSLTQGLGV